MAGVDEAPQHADSAQLPQRLLVTLVAGGKVPERPAGVGDDGERVRGELLQQRGQAAVLPQDLSAEEEETERDNVRGSAGKNNIW